MTVLHRLLAATTALVCATSVAHASVPTTNYSWAKPTVGADSDNWGALINTDLDGIDSIVFGVSGVANAACPKAGCTYTGSVTFSGPSFVITGAAGTNRALSLQTAGSNRWFFGASAGAESGSNAGSDFFINRDNDVGAFIDTPLLISRQTGSITIANGLTVTGGITGGLTGNVTGTLTGNASGNAGTATKLATGRTLAITGDLSWTSPSFDGSGNVTAAGTLATVNSGPGSCGDSTHFCTVTTNGKGLVTAQSAVAVPSPIKAWATIGAAVPTLNAQLNVANVSKPSTGHYDITFTSSLADTQYAVVFGIEGVSGTNNSTVCAVNNNTKSTGGFSIICQLSNATQGTSFTDPAELYFSVLR